MRLVPSLAAAVALLAAPWPACAEAPVVAPAPSVSGPAPSAPAPRTAPLRTPCSGKKGGVDRCENGKFICKDGTTSASRKVCTAPDKKAG
jgi:hypothetical protein